MLNVDIHTYVCMYIRVHVCVQVNVHSRTEPGPAADLRCESVSVSTGDDKHPPPPHDNFRTIVLLRRKYLFDPLGGERDSPVGETPGVA
jgi:hypothetical protein